MTQAAYRADAVSRSYPIVVEVEYKVTLDGKCVWAGHGWTLRMSSTAIRFVPERPLPGGNDIELSIAWPALLNDKVGLQLCIKGSVVENKPNCVVVLILRYEFRTRSLKAAGLPGIPLNADARIQCVTSSPCMAVRCP